VRSCQANALRTTQYKQKETLTHDLPPEIGRLILAGIFGLGWLLAIAVSLLFWTPQTLQAGLNLWYDAASF
jgi:hypothetical protein